MDSIAPVGRSACYYQQMRIINVEQGTEQWLKMRIGMITGTRLKGVMGSKVVQKTLMNELIAEQMTGLPKQIFVNAAMKWGTDNEEFAVWAYEHKYKRTTQEVGFCISDEFPYLGLSPDRLIMTSNKYRRAVEVKAPMTETVVKYILDGGIPPEYKWQVVNYFLVCEDLTHLDFVIYDPRIRDVERKLTKIEVTRKDVASDIAAAKERLVEFRINWEEKLKQLGL